MSVAFGKHDDSMGDDQVEYPKLLAEALSWRGRIWSRPDAAVGVHEAGWTSLDEILASDAAIEEWLDYEGSFTPSLDRLGRAAYLLTDYCNLLLPVLVPIFVGRHIVPDLRPSAIALQYSSHPIAHKGRLLEERLYRLRFLTGGVGSAEAVCARRDVAALRERFRLGLEHHLEALIAPLNRLTRSSRSALWRLAGDAVGAAFLEAGQRLNARTESLDHALAILKSPGSPLKNKQLHFFDIAIPDPHDHAKDLLRRTFRARGGCCRYYTAEGGSLCSTCVLKDRETRDRDITNAMRRFLSSGRLPDLHDH
jgi:Ferric iron reductase FhuF-like transporter/FhuF 2Fe-2S C-terminal domain